MMWAVLLGVFLGASLNIWADSLPSGSFEKFAAKLVSIVFLAGPGIFSIFVGDRRERQRRAENRDRQIEDKLRYAVESLFPGENPRTIRANVMLPDADELFIAYRWNMDTWKDASLRLPMGSGVAGAAWDHAKRAGNADRWRPLTAPEITSGELDAWNIDRQVAEMTDHIKWIVSTPILSGSTRDVLGILNIDGVDPLGDPAIIRSNDLYHRCATLAEVLANYLEQG